MAVSESESHVVATKKQKKNKKVKVEEVEEAVAAEEPVVEQAEEPVPEPEESPKKNKKDKKKKAKKEAEPEPEKEPEPVKEEEEEEEEPLVKNGNGKQHEEVEYVIDDAKVNEAVKAIESVSEELVEKLKKPALKVLKKFNQEGVNAVAAAIAVLSGANKKPVQSGKSVLTDRDVS